MEATKTHCAIKLLTATVLKPVLAASLSNLIMFWSEDLNVLPFSRYRAFPSAWKQIVFSYQVVWARHARSYVVEFFMIVSVRVSCTVFDVPSQSWKGNVRARDSQCRSHLRPLMMGQRQSRTNHGSLCHEARTLHDPFLCLCVWWVHNSNQSSCLCWPSSWSAPVTPLDGWVSHRGEG